MLIADSQVHIWAADTPERPWPPGRAAQAQKPYPVTATMVLSAMDEAGVDRAVLVPPSWEGDYNDLVIDAARRYPERFAAMGRLSIERRDSRALITGWKQQGMLGIRLTFHIPEHRKWLFDGTADWLWPVAERAGLPIMVYAPTSVRKLEDVAARHPSLRLVIDHLALGVHARGNLAFVELADVCRLARFPNVAVKASALPCHSMLPYPFRDLHPHIRRVYDSFGPKRMFWGTDWTRLPCPWREAVTLFTEELPWLTAEDQRWIMGTALCGWIGWPLTSPRRDPLYAA